MLGSILCDDKYGKGAWHKQLLIGAHPAWDLSSAIVYSRFAQTAIDDPVGQPEG